MRRGDIINYLIKSKGYKTYLEIGLDNPDLNYNNIICESKESCDPYMNEDWDGKYDRNNLPDNIKEILTYHMTSDEMFEINDKKYDIIFIDGLHIQEQIDKDVMNSLKHLNKGGIIVMHDCLPETENSQIVPRIQSVWNGDVWKTMAKVIASGIEGYVIDTDYGCGLIPYTEKEYIPYDDETLTWEKFSAERNNLMNVISEEEFKKLFLS